MNLSPSRASGLVTPLLTWYARYHRAFPWRETRDPYRIWITEILAQQTQLATVLPYYQKFLARFPNVRVLAQARLTTVLKVWEGAGYYARARNLHRAAREIVTRFDGKIPRDVNTLLSLPGIGPYSARALASIAFGADEPALDGNGMRVLCRVFALRGNPKTARVNRRLWHLARELIPRGRAGAFNQALMDLGATICTPRNPQCDACPLSRACEAKRLGIQWQLPTPARKKKLPHYDVAAGIIWKDGRILISRRPEEGLLGGLWEFPGGKPEEGEDLPSACAREIREELGVRVRVGAEYVAVEHRYSHFAITLHAFTCQYLRGQPRALQVADWKWVHPRDLRKYAFPAANRKIIELLMAKSEL
jgi:A/G-specific adenine glycosylase